MQIPVTLESFKFANESIEAYVPSAEWILKKYQSAKTAGVNPPFPYWAQVWPASKGLCEMIANQPDLVKDKEVMELAAGIGLPSLLSARFAKSVTGSDYIPAAVDIMRRSILYNKINNMKSVLMDWNNLNDELNTDVLLLSDVNYDPAGFDILFKIMQRFINMNTTIVISTPQRLTGKSFMETLLPWRRQEEEIAVLHNNEIVYTSIWLLKK